MMHWLRGPGDALPDGVGVRVALAIRVGVDVDAEVGAEVDADADVDVDVGVATAVAVDGVGDSLPTTMRRPVIPSARWLLTEQ